MEDYASILKQKQKCRPRKNTKMISDSQIEGPADSDRSAIERRKTVIQPR
jgi:hypothetical protein